MGGILWEALVIRAERCLLQTKLCPSCGCCSHHMGLPSEATARLLDPPVPSGFSWNAMLQGRTCLLSSC